MASARSFLAALGLAFAVAGVVIASPIDTYIGLGVLIVGAFLFILPFMSSRSDD